MAFDLVGNIVLSSSGIDKFTNELKSKLQSIPTNVDIKFNRGDTRAISSTTRQLDRFIQTLDRLPPSATKASQALTEFFSRFNIAGSAVNNFGTGKVVRDLTVLERQVDRASGRIQNFGDRLALTFERFAAFTIISGGVFGFIAAIAGGVKAGIDFERELVRVKQVSDASEQTLGELADEVGRLGAAFGTSSQELIKASVTLSQAGFSADDTRQLLETLALTDLSPTFDSIENSTEGVIAIFNQFGIGVDQMQEAFSGINEVAARFAVESSDIIDAVKIAGGVFSSASKGISEGTDALAEFQGLITAVRQTTRQNANQIATALRTIIPRLQRPRTVEFLRGFGVDLLEENRFIGPFRALEEISELISKLPSGDPRIAQIIEQIAGIRQFGRVLPILQNFNLAVEAQGVALAGSNSLVDDATIAQEALSVQLRQTGEEFLKLLRGVVATDTFQELTKASLSLANAILKIADAAKEVLPVLALVFGIRGAQRIFKGGLTGAGTTVFGVQGGGIIPRFESGGRQRGGNLALLEPGEVVIKRGRAQQLGVDNLLGLNERFPRFAMGGPIDFSRKGPIARVPGTGSGDKVLSKVQSGDIILNRNAAAALPKFQSGGKFNSLIPNFVSPRSPILGLQSGTTNIIGNPIFREVFQNISREMTQTFNKSISRQGMSDELVRMLIGREPSRLQSGGDIKNLLVKEVRKTKSENLVQDLGKISRREEFRKLVNDKMQGGGKFIGFQNIPTTLSGLNLSKELQKKLSDSRKYQANQLSQFSFRVSAEESRLLIDKLSSFYGAQQPIVRLTNTALEKEGAKGLFRLPEFETGNTRVVRPRINLRRIHPDIESIAHEFAHHLDVSRLGISSEPPIHLNDVASTIRKLQKDERLITRFGEVAEFQAGGIGGLVFPQFQSGGLFSSSANKIQTVPGTGTGDRIFGRLEPDSVVINRTAVRALGSSNILDFAKQKFQVGGIGGANVLLEPGEAVVGSQLAKRIGVQKLNRINQEIPRFRGGGLFGKRLPRFQIGSSDIPELPENIRLQRGSTELSDALLSTAEVLKSFGKTSRSILLSLSNTLKGIQTPAQGLDRVNDLLVRKTKEFNDSFKILQPLSSATGQVQTPRIFSVPLPEVPDRLRSSDFLRELDISVRKLSLLGVSSERITRSFSNIINASNSAAEGIVRIRTVTNNLELNASRQQGLRGGGTSSGSLPIFAALGSQSLGREQEIRTRIRQQNDLERGLSLARDRARLETVSFSVGSQIVDAIQQTVQKELGSGVSPDISRTERLRAERTISPSVLVGQLPFRRTAARQSGFNDIEESFQRVVKNLNKEIGDISSGISFGNISENINKQNIKNFQKFQLENKSLLVGSGVERLRDQPSLPISPVLSFKDIQDGIKKANERIRSSTSQQIIVPVRPVLTENLVQDIVGRRTFQGRRFVLDDRRQRALAASNAARVRQRQRELEQEFRQRELLGDPAQLREQFPLLIPSVSSTGRSRRQQASQILREARRRGNDEREALRLAGFRLPGQIEREGFTVPLQPVPTRRELAQQRLRERGGQGFFGLRGGITGRLDRLDRGIRGTVGGTVSRFLPQANLQNLALGGLLLSQTLPEFESPVGAGFGDAVTGGLTGSILGSFISPQFAAIGAIVGAFSSALSSAQQKLEQVAFEKLQSSVEGFVSALDNFRLTGNLEVLNSINAKLREDFAEVQNALSSRQSRLSSLGAFTQGFDFTGNRVELSSEIGALERFFKFDLPSGLEQFLDPVGIFNAGADRSNVFNVDSRLADRERQARRSIERGLGQERATALGGTDAQKLARQAILEQLRRGISRTNLVIPESIFADPGTQRALVQAERKIRELGEVDVLNVSQEGDLAAAQNLRQNIIDQEIKSAQKQLNQTNKTTQSFLSLTLSLERTNAAIVGVQAGLERFSEIQRSFDVRAPVVEARAEGRLISGPRLLQNPFEFLERATTQEIRRALGNLNLGNVNTELLDFSRLSDDFNLRLLERARREPTISASEAIDEEITTGAFRNLGQELRLKLGEAISQIPALEVPFDDQGKPIQGISLQEFIRSVDGNVVGTVFEDLSKQSRDLAQVFSSLVQASNEVRSRFIEGLNQRSQLEERLNEQLRNIVVSRTNVQNILAEARGIEIPVEQRVRVQENLIRQRTQVTDPITGRLGLPGTTDPSQILNNLDAILSRRQEIERDRRINPLLRDNAVASLNTAFNENIAALRDLSQNIVGLADIQSELARIQSRREGSRQEVFGLFGAGVSELQQRFRNLTAFNRFQQSGLAGLQGTTLTRENIIQGFEERRRFRELGGATPQQLEQFDLDFLRQIQRSGFPIPRELELAFTRREEGQRERELISQLEASTQRYIDANEALAKVLQEGFNRFTEFNNQRFLQENNALLQAGAPLQNNERLIQSNERLIQSLDGLGFRLENILGRLPVVDVPQPINRQFGGIIPGVGSGDKVPVLAEPGELFLNKRAVQALGLSNLNRLNKMFPRFQKGGKVGRFQQGGSVQFGGFNFTQPLNVRIVNLNELDNSRVTFQDFIRQQQQQNQQQVQAPQQPVRQLSRREQFVQERELRRRQFFEDRERRHLGFTQATGRESREERNRRFERHRINFQATGRADLSASIQRRLDREQAVAQEQNQRELKETRERALRGLVLPERDTPPSPLRKFLTELNRTGADLPIARTPTPVRRPTILELPEPKPLKFEPSEELQQFIRTQQSNPVLTELFKIGGEVSRESSGIIAPSRETGLTRRAETVLAGLPKFDKNIASAEEFEAAALKLDEFGRKIGSLNFSRLTDRANLGNIQDLGPAPFKDVPTRQVEQFGRTLNNLQSQVLRERTRESQARRPFIPFDIEPAQSQAGLLTFENDLLVNSIADIINQVRTGGKNLFAPPFGFEKRGGRIPAFLPDQQVIPRDIGGGGGFFSVPDAPVNRLREASVSNLLDRIPRNLLVRPQPVPESGNILQPLIQNINSRLNFTPLQNAIGDQVQANNNLAQVISTNFGRFGEDFNQSFLKSLDTFQRIAENIRIPEKIQIEGKHQVEVNISGAQALASIKPELAKLVENSIRGAFQKYTNNGTLVDNFDAPPVFQRG